MKSYFLLLIILLGQNLFSQQTDQVDFERISASISFPEKGKIEGIVSVSFYIKTVIDSVYLDAVNMNVDGVHLISDNLSQFDYSYANDKLVFKHRFEKDQKYIVSFKYSAQPKKALYFVGESIWSQGQGKYTSNWLPSIDDMNDKIKFDLSVKYDNRFTVLSNGVLKSEKSIDTHQIQWDYEMQKPMSSYLVALAIGDYDKKIEISDSGIPLEYYYYPQDSAKVNSTYRYSKRIFDFLENEIGVNYPWQIYRQAPVADFLYAGMENTTLTLFSDALMIDDIAYNDQNYINVNAHELAHQWFGNLVTETSGEHHWLQEGFATYYALLAERELFGEDYYYWKLYEYAQDLLEQEQSGNHTSLMNPKSSSLTFYQKGCWVLHMLRESIGEEAFKAGVKNYINKYQFKNVTTSNFVKAVEATSSQDLTAFFDLWVVDSILPQDSMVKSLKKSDFISEYLNVSCVENTLKCKDYLVSDISDKAKIKIIKQPNYEIKLEDFNNSWEVRQAIAQKMATIPDVFKASYESLLDDPSYITIETALYNLWVNFPADRSRYLEKTKAIYGLSDYNVRLLWLALNLNTLEYQSANKKAVVDELKSYTDSKFGADLRMNAFKYLKLLNAFDRFTIENLNAATTHHNWRLQKFSRELLKTLEKQPEYELLLKI